MLTCKGQFIKTEYRIENIELAVVTDGSISACVQI